MNTPCDTEVSVAATVAETVTMTETVTVTMTETVTATRTETGTAMADHRMEARER